MQAPSRLVLVLLTLLLAGGPVLGAASVRAPGLRVQGPASSHSVAARVVTFLASGLAVFGAIKMRAIPDLTQKYKTRAGAAQGDYQAGVQSAGPDWEAGARAGEPNYEAGVQEAIGRKRYGRGIAAAGSAKYVKNALELGVQRYPQGVNQGADAWARGFAPVAEKIKSLNLPPKGPKRSPQNQARAAMVALELGKMKDGQ